MFRSKSFDQMIKKLKMIGLIGHLPMQHDSIKIYLNKFYLNEDSNNLEKRSRGMNKIDITTELGKTIELKTRRNVSINDIPAFIHTYFAEIWEFRLQKDVWCLYLLYATNSGFLSAETEISKKVIEYMEAVELMVREEDGIEEEGILVPVKNILYVEALRRENQELQDENQELQGEIQKLQEANKNKNKEIDRLKNFIKK